MITPSPWEQELLNKTYANTLISTNFCLGRNTVLHPFKIEIKKQRTDVNWYIFFFCFSTIFSIRESKTWLICCCCCNSTSVWLCWSFLSWSSPSLREWFNYPFSLRNSTASLQRSFSFSSSLPPLHLPHIFCYFLPNVPWPFLDFFCSLLFFFNLFLVYTTSANSSIFFADKLFNYGVNFIDLRINAGCFDFVSFFSGISHAAESSGLYMTSWGP